MDKRARGFDPPGFVRMFYNSGSRPSSERNIFCVVHLVFAAAVFLALATVSLGETVKLSVDPTTGSDAVCGLNSPTPCASVVAAVNKIPVGKFGSVQLSAGEHFVTDVQIVAKHVEILGDMSLDDPSLGVFRKYASKLLCNGRCFSVLCGNLSSQTCSSVTHLTLQDVRMLGIKRVDGPGGAVWVSGPGLTMRRVHASNFQAGRGGIVSLDKSTQNSLFRTVLFEDSFVVNDTVGVENGVNDGLAHGGCMCAVNNEWDADFTLEIRDSMFRNCFADGSGALAIEFVNTTVTGTTFENCSSTNGNGGYGGSITFGINEGSDPVANLYMYEVNIFNAFSPDAAGSIYFGGNEFHFINSHVENSTSLGTDGGGFMYFMRLSLFMQNSTIRNCTAPNGGAIVAVRSVVFEDVLFEDNWATFRAGALYLNAEWNLTARNTVFKNNYVSAGVGGAVYSYFKNVSFYGCTFENNTSALEGGSMVLDPSAANSTIAFYDSRFNLSHSYTRGGTFMVSGDPTVALLLDNITAEHSLATYGGFLWSFAGTVTIRRSTFRYCTASSAGGVLDVIENTKLTVTDSTFIGCSAPFAGAILFEGGAATATMSRYTARIEGSNFYDNVATQDMGGAIMMADESNHMIITRSKFYGNSARGSGGAVDIRGFHCEVTDSEFIKNSALTAGGAVHVQFNALFKLRNTKFIVNQALSGQGGALSLTSSAILRAVGLTFRRNAARIGGAVYQELDSVITLSESTFVRNSAQEGGATYSCQSSIFVGLASSFRMNQALKTYGGAASVLDTSSVTLRSSNGSGNSALLNGGFLSVVGSAKAELSACFLAGNSAAMGGGSLYGNDKSSLTASGVSFFGNNATNGYGGAVQIEGKEMHVSLSNCSFLRNRAVAGGSVFVTSGASGEIVYSYFSNNTAESVASTPLSAATGTGATGTMPSSDSAVSDKGGGLLVTAAKDSTLNISSLTFVNNFAAQGGAYFLNSYLPKITFPNCTECTNAGGNYAQFGTFSATVPFTATLVTNSSSSSANSNFISNGAGNTTINSNSVSSGSILVTNQIPVPVFTAYLFDWFGNSARSGTQSFCRIVPHPNLSGQLEVPVTQTQTSSSCTWERVIPLLYDTNDAQNGFTFSTLLEVYNPANEFPSIFVNMTFSFCPAGSYVDGAMGICSLCEYGRYCPAGQPMSVCPDGSYAFQTGAVGLSSCLSCQSGSVCAGGNFTVLRYYWVSMDNIENDQTMYQCQLDGCQQVTYDTNLPVNQSRSGQCATGYKESRVCGKCDKDYYLILGSCSICDPTYKDLWVLLAILVVVAWVFINYVANIFGSVNIILSEMQFISIFANYNLQWFYGWILLALKIFNASLFNVDILGPECVLGYYTYNNRWVVAVVTPLVGMGLYCFSFLQSELLIMLKRRNTEPRSNRVLKTFGSMLNFLDICHISVCVTVMGNFEPAKYDQMVLAVDPTVLWSSSMRVNLEAYAWLLLVTYVYGFPLILALVLLYGKLTNKFEEQSVYTEAFGWLYGDLKTGWWWWYLMITVGRRLAFSVLYVFLYNSPDLQSLLTLIILVLSILLHYREWPYKDNSYNILTAVLFLAQFCFMLGGILNTWMNPPMASTPKAFAATGVILIAICTVAMLPYETYAHWARYSVNKWARKYTDSQVDSLFTRTWKNLFGKSIQEDEMKKLAVDIKRTRSLRENAKDLVPLEQITDWFYARTIYRFLNVATEDEIALLQQVRHLFSKESLSEEDKIEAKAFFQPFPVALRYAVVYELLESTPGGLMKSNHSSSRVLQEIEDDRARISMSSDASTSMPRTDNGRSPSARMSVDGAGLALSDASISTNGVLSGPTGAGFIDASNSLHSMNLIELRQLGRRVKKEKAKWLDSIHLVLRKSTIVEVASWLLYGSEDCRIVLRNLIHAIRYHVVVENLTDKSVLKGTELYSESEGEKGGAEGGQGTAAGGGGAGECSTDAGADDGHHFRKDMKTKLSKAKSAVTVWQMRNFR